MTREEAMTKYPRFDLTTTVGVGKMINAAKKPGEIGPTEAIVIMKTISRAMRIAKAWDNRDIDNPEDLWRACVAADAEETDE